MNMLLNRYALMLMTVIALLTSAVATPAASVAVRDATGKWHRPLEAKENKASVLLFVAHDCPISNSYAPEINRLYAQYAKQNIRFYVVYADSKITATAARKHANDFAFKSSLLLDTKHELAKATGRDGDARSDCAAAGRQANLSRTHRQQAHRVW
jgi:peroxiredoxin